MKSKDTVLFLICLVIGLSPYSLAVEGKFFGGIGSRIRYTPEHGFEAAYYFSLRNGVTKQEPSYTALVRMASMWPKSGHYQHEFNLPNYNVPLPYVHQIYIKTKMPLWEGPSLITFGDAPINYSPYIIHTGTGGSGKRGLHFHDFQFGNYKVDGFLFWHQNMNNPVYGFQLERKYNTYHLKGTFAELRNKEGLNETAFGLEFEKPLTFGKTKGICAFQKTGDELFSLKEISINTPLGLDSQINIVLRDFEPGFRPTFSSRTIRDDFSSINPIDMHYGLKGGSFELKTRFTGKQVVLVKDIYENRDYKRDLTNIEAYESHEKLVFSGRIIGFNATISHQNRTTLFKGYDNDNLIKGSSSWIQLRKQKVTDSLILSGEYIYWNDIGTPVLDHNMQLGRIVNETGNNLIFSLQPRKGFFSGFKFLAGIKRIDERADVNESKLYKTIGFDYRTLTGIQVICRYTEPNLEEPNDFRIPTGKRPRNALDLYDRFGRRVDLDNVIEVRYLSNF